MDTSTVGKLDLQNAATESGTSITNTQRELNAISSYTGKALNVAKDILPAWTNNDIGASGNNIFQRANLLTAEFNPSTGHSHSGAAGEAPPINLVTSVNGFLPLANAGLGTNLFNQNAIIYLSGSTFTSANAYWANSGTKFGMYTSSPSAGFDLNGTISIRQDNDASTGNVTALGFDTSLVRFSTSPTIYGIDSTGVENTFLFLMNSATGSITIANESASASVANRVVTGTSEDFTLTGGGMALVGYDKTSQRWRLMGGGGSGAGTTSYQSSNFTGTTITAGDDFFQRWRYTGSSAQVLTSIDFTNLPDGGQIEILGLSDTNTITVNHNDTAGGIFLNGSWEGTRGVVLRLIKDSSLNLLVEVSRS